MVVALLERDEARRMGSTNTGLSVLSRLVSDGELTKVEANHFGLNLNLVENLSIVNTNNRPNHFRDDDHVAQVSLDNLGLTLAVSGSLLGLAQLLDEGVGTTLDSALEATASTGVEHLHKLFSGHGKELVELDSTEGKLAEGTLLLKLSGVNISLNMVSYLFKEEKYGWMDSERLEGHLPYGRVSDKGWPILE
jgi:hypothetical protein